MRRRLDGGVRLQVFSRVFLVAAGSALAWAVAWRIFGYAAPRPGYAVVAGLALAAGIVWILLSRRGVREAANVADAFFKLKDGLVSWLDFKAAGLEGEIYQLNERHLVSRVATLEVPQIPVPKPRKIIAFGLLLAAAAFFLALLPHSAAVRDRLAREELAGKRSAEIEKQVDEAIEEIINAMSEEERELLSPEAMREWAKQLEATKDARENEKQLARLEQQISKAMQGLEARQDEAVLKLAAGELSKSSLADVRQLGKQLDAKDFEKAAQELKDMKPGAKPKMTPEELEKLRKNAAKSRDMAKRMADGARQRDFSKMKPGDNRNAKPGEDQQRGMEEMLEELDGESRELAKELEEGDEPGEDAEAMAGKVGGKMDELGKRLGKLGARQKAKSKLNALRGGLGEARQFAQGKSQSLGLAQSTAQSMQPGGKEAGRGSDSSRRAEQDDFKDNGNRVEVKGQQNADGPSSSSVESAESGSGIAGRANVAKQREFKQQLESLVHRDDIPEALKLGVREYFEKVHETDSATK
ncbi:MAG: hypothetical protein V4689_03195 [Verrucomicrobiota bacterium]